MRQLLSLSLAASVFTACREAPRSEGLGGVTVKVPPGFVLDEKATQAMLKQPQATRMEAKVFHKPGAGLTRIALTESVVPLPPASRRASVKDTLSVVLNDGVAVGTGQPGLTSLLKSREESERDLRFTLLSSAGSLVSYTRGRLALTADGLAQGVAVCQCLSDCPVCEQLLTTVELRGAPGALLLTATTP